MTKMLDALSGANRPVIPPRTIPFHTPAQNFETLQSLNEVFDRRELFFELFLSGRNFLFGERR